MNEYIEEVRIQNKIKTERGEGLFLLARKYLA